MKTTNCIACLRILTADEVALNQRLLGAHIATFCCIDCLAVKLNTTTQKLQELIVRFKDMGCTYFTRLMEAVPDEKTNDGM